MILQAEVPVAVRNFLVVDFGYAFGRDETRVEVTDFIAALDLNGDVQVFENENGDWTLEVDGDFYPMFEA